MKLMNEKLLMSGYIFKNNLGEFRKPVYICRIRTQDNFVNKFVGMLS